MEINNSEKNIPKMDLVIKTEIDRFEEEESAEYSIMETNEEILVTVKQEISNCIGEETDYCFPSNSSTEDIDNLKEQ